MMKYWIGPPLEDADDAEHERDADGTGDREAKRERVAGTVRLRVGDDAARARDLGGLGGDDDERGLGHGGAEPEGEREGEQRAEAALAGEGGGHRLAEREEAHLQALNEQGQTQEDEHETDDGPAQVGEGLAEHHGLEEDDDEDDGGEIPRRIGQQAEEAPKASRHGTQVQAKADGPPGWPGAPSATRLEPTTSRAPGARTGVR